MTQFLLFWLAANCVAVGLVWIFTIGLGRQVSVKDAPRVVVIVAVKGPDVEFDHFLANLFRQDYPFFRAIFSVESAADPAVAVIEGYRARMPDRVALVIAGLSQNEGQKTTNLRAALKQIVPNDEVVVFADANIRPSPDWLKRLVAPLVKGEADIVSGFSWIVAGNRSLYTFLIASMSAAMVTIPRLPLLNAAWGGSTALKRECCEALNLDQAWRGTLSDDLQLTVVAQRAGYVIAAPREILLRSFLANKRLRDVVAEAVRWLLLFRVYLPATYALAMAGLTFMAAGWIVALVGALAGRPEAINIVIAAFALMLLRSMGRMCIVIRLWGKAGFAENRLYFILDPLLAPFAMVTSAACGWIALFTRTTIWAGITYEIIGPRQVKVLSRRALKR